MLPSPEKEGAEAPNEDPGHRARPSILAHIDRERVRRRARRHASTRSHQAGRKLDAWGYAMLTPERRPSDYLMSDAERREYARYLVEVEHWANWEVRLVLTAPGVRDRGPRYGYTRERVAA